METLFKIPVTPGTSQLMPENEANDNYPIKRLSIIIPAYNEEKTIALILDRINDVKHSIGNRVLTFLSNMFSNLNLKPATS